MHAGIPLLLKDGTEVSWEQVIAAFNAGTAVVAHQRAENHTASGLMLDGVLLDTRGQCHSMWEEVWTAKAKSLQQCFLVLTGKY